VADAPSGVPVRLSETRLNGCTDFPLWVNGCAIELSSCLWRFSYTLLPPPHRSRQAVRPLTKTHRFSQFQAAHQKSSF
jgi:hypothetical protein